MTGGASDKESACQCGRRKRLGFDPWVKRLPGEGDGNLLQYCYRGAWWAAVHRATKTGTLLC